MQPEHIPVGDLFARECTYVVPLFQRPYVWDKVRWEPLWDDVARVARDACRGLRKVRPHFLGSVVLQQRQNGITEGPRREVIDGQQRLIVTTNLPFSEWSQVIPTRGCARR